MSIFKVAKLFNKKFAQNKRKIVTIDDSGTVSTDEDFEHPEKLERKDPELEYGSEEYWELAEPYVSSNKLDKLHFVVDNEINKVLRLAGLVYKPDLLWVSIGQNEPELWIHINKEYKKLTSSDEVHLPEDAGKQTEDVLGAHIMSTMLDGIQEDKHSPMQRVRLLKQLPELVGAQINNKMTYWVLDKGNERYRKANVAEPFVLPPIALENLDMSENELKMLAIAKRFQIKLAEEVPETLSGSNEYNPESLPETEQEIDYELEVPVTEREPQFEDEDLTDAEKVFLNKSLDNMYELFAESDSSSEMMQALDKIIQNIKRKLSL